MRTIVPGVRTFVLICFLSLSALRGTAQSIGTANGKFEIGLGLGPLFFLGDLGGNYGQGTRFVKDVNPSTINLAKGLFMSVAPTEWLAFRVAINQGKIEGDDALTKENGGEERYRKERNLKFRSNIIEGYAGLELYPTVFFERYEGLAKKLRPYGLIGVGAVRFNPQGQYIGANGKATWVDLRPLHLEGQGFEEYPDHKEYSTVSLIVPIGAGFKYYVNDNFYVGFEITHRKSFTDYMDDVSTTYIDNGLFAKYLSPEQTAMANQLYYRGNLVPNAPVTRNPPVGDIRGNPKQNDSYFSSIIRMGFRLNSWNSPLSVKQMRCPSFY